jgi:hypothetical protein
MRPSTLHAHIRDSVRNVVSKRYESGMRFVLESGSAEGFLRDLLAIELRERGYSPIREYRAKSGHVDLALMKEASPECIEAKQLHLKDGAQFVENIVNDVKRHKRRCLAVVYIVDERRSRFKIQCPSFDGKNRNTKHGVGEIMKALRHSFRKIYPDTEKQARVRRFERAGRLDLYAFVVENVR